MTKKYNYTEKTGRPTKYSEKILEKAQKYIKKSKDGMKKVLEYANNKTGRKRFRYQLKVNLPTIEGLALSLKITRETLYQWEGEHEEFSDTLEEVRQLQANRLISKALAGEYNPLIAKLLLTKHGYKDEKEVEHKGKLIILDE